MDDNRTEVIDLTDAEGRDTLWSLTYVTERCEPGDVYRLHWALVGAQPNGAALEVASVLVQWADRFVHVLEGPREQVLAVFDGFVLGGEREGSVFLADQGPISSRSIDPAQVLDIRGTASAHEADRVERAVLEILTSDCAAGRPSAADLILSVLPSDGTARIAA